MGTNECADIVTSESRGKTKAVREKRKTTGAYVVFTTRWVPLYSFKPLAIHCRLWLCCSTRSLGPRWAYALEYIAGAICKAAAHDQLVGPRIFSAKLYGSIEQKALTLVIWRATLSRQQWLQVFF